MHDIEAVSVQPYASYISIQKHIFKNLRISGEIEVALVSMILTWPPRIAFILLKIRLSVIILVTYPPDSKASNLVLQHFSTNQYLQPFADFSSSWIF